MGKHVRLHRLWIVVALALTAQPALAGSPPRVERLPSGVPSASAVPGEAIVRFEHGTTPAERLATRRAADVELDRALRVPQAQVVEIDGSVAAAVEALERDPDVAYAQPNYRYRALAVDPPDDTLFGSLWGLQGTPGVNALAAWERTRGSGQVIAVVDTGVAADHPDVEGSLWAGPGGIGGHDFVDGDDDPDDYNFHGTHVAGTAAATAGNGLGIAGVAPDARIMAVRALDGDGGGSSADIGNGISFAAQSGAGVINLSLGGPANVEDHFMANAVAVADEHDVVVVAAAGNDFHKDNDVSPTTPCTLPNPNLICVAAITPSGGLASFSNVGATTVDVGAPGANVLSARADYTEVFGDDFSPASAWSTSTSNGGAPWTAVGSPNSDGNTAVADTPYGQAADPDFYAQGILIKAAPLSLAGRRGCRIHFEARYDLEQGFDYLRAGAVAGSESDDRLLTGSSDGSFRGEEASISGLDGEAAVSPRFTVLSDASIEGEGVYLDDLHVLCRDSTYDGDSYVAFNGTSMAAPHVAGVAALVRAADPGVPDTQVVEAIEAGGVALPSLAGVTSSGRAVDAPGAIAAALALPNVAAAAPVPSAHPSNAGPRIDLRRSKATIRVSRKGRFAYALRATPGVAGEAVFRTRTRVFVSRRARMTLARKRFSVLGSGRAVLKARLSRRKLAILRRDRRLSVLVSVTARDSDGRRATAAKALTLKAPRR